MLQEMILQNRNHSSIILWGVRINESMDDDAFYNRTNKIAPPAGPQPRHLRRAIPSASCWKRRSTFPSRPLRGTANKPDPPVWLVCNIKINVSAYCVIAAGVCTRFSLLHSGYE